MIFQAFWVTFTKEVGPNGPGTMGPSAPAGRGPGPSTLPQALCVGAACGAVPWAPAHGTGHHSRASLHGHGALLRAEVGGLGRQHTCEMSLICTHKMDNVYMWAMLQ